MTILTEIASQLPDNNVGSITPAVLRQVLVDMVSDYGSVASSGDSTALATAEAYTDTHVSGLAPLASPALTGNPTAPTPTLGDSDTSIATTAFVQAAIAALINSAPGALDTLKELADAIGDDASFAATMTTALAAKAPLASPALTGNPTAPTQTGTDNSTKLATTAFVKGLIAALTGQMPATATNDDATSGHVGEFISSEILVAGRLTLVSATPKDITSISLTAGDWDVWGTVSTLPTGGSLSQTFMAAWISATSATMPTIPNGGAYQDSRLNITGGLPTSLTAGKRRLSLASTTTVYITAQVAWTSGTSMEAYGGIYARRVR